MPHLSPMNWLLSFFMIWLFFTVLIMLNWWNNNTITTVTPTKSSLESFSSPWFL